MSLVISVRSQDKTILPIHWGIYIASQIPLLSKLQSHNTEYCKTSAVLVPDSNRHDSHSTQVNHPVLLNRMMIQYSFFQETFYCGMNMGILSQEL